MECLICGTTDGLSGIPVMEVFGSTKRLFACTAHYRDAEDIARKMSL